MGHKCLSVTKPLTLNTSNIYCHRFSLYSLCHKANWLTDVFVTEVNDWNVHRKWATMSRIQTLPIQTRATYRCEIRVMDDNVRWRRHDSDPVFFSSLVCRGCFLHPMGWIQNQNTLPEIMPSSPIQFSQVLYSVVPFVNLLVCWYKEHRPVWMELLWRVALPRLTDDWLSCRVRHDFMSHMLVKSWLHFALGCQMVRLKF